MVTQTHRSVILLGLLVRIYIGLGTTVTQPYFLWSFPNWLLICHNFASLYVPIFVVLSLANLTHLS